MELEPTPCIKNCTTLSDGDYQSCEGCGGYVVCVTGDRYEKTCVGGQVWDDSYKRCLNTSTTCGLEVHHPTTTAT